MTIAITEQIVFAYMGGALSALTIGFLAWVIRQGIWAALVLIVPFGLLHALMFIGVFL